MPNKKIQVLLTTFEYFADPEGKHRQAPKGMLSIYKAKTIIESETSSKTETNQNESKMEIEEEQNEYREEIAEEDLSTTISYAFDTDIIDRIVGSEENTKYAYYIGIFNNFLLNSVSEKNPASLQAFWKTLANDASLSLEDALAILFHADDTSVGTKISEACGDILKTGELNVDDVQMLIDGLTTTAKYKEAASTSFAFRSSAHPLGLVQQLQTYTFFTPGSLANINGFAKKLYFDPAYAAFKKFLSKKSLLTKPDETNQSDVPDKILRLIHNINSTTYASDRNVKKLVDTLVQIITKYFNGPVKLAANHPGLIGKDMKNTVRNQLQRMLKNFVYNKESQNKFVIIGSDYYFIAHAENLTTQKTSRVLMKIETRDSNNSEVYSLLRVRKKDELLEQLLDKANINKNLFIHTIIKRADTYYFIFIKSGKEVKNHETKEMVVTKLASTENGLRLIEVQLDNAFLAEYKDDDSSDYLHPSLHFGRKILPNATFMLLADFLNHRAMDAVQKKLAQHFKNELLKQWKTNPQKSSPYLHDCAEAIAQRALSIMDATFVSPAIKIATFLPKSVTQSYPQTGKEQTEAMMEKLGPNSSGANFVTWSIMEKLVLSNLELQNAFFGSEFAFLDTQDKSKVLQESVEPTKIDINELAKHNYAWLKVLHDIYNNLHKESQMPDEEFFKIAITDMLLNNYPTDLVLKKIKENKENKENKDCKLDNICLQPIKHLQCAEISLNLLQLAFLQKDKGFFEKISKLGLSNETILPHVQKVVQSVDTQEKFYQWFSKEFGKLEISPNSSRFHRKASVTNIDGAPLYTPPQPSEKKQCSIM